MDSLTRPGDNLYTVREQGKIRWQVKTPDPLIGGVLATAGNLLFVGEGDGHFNALDSRTGERLWRFDCGAGVNAPPVAFRVDTRQYVAVAAGGNQLFGYKTGDAVYVFGLDD
jgi:glucose dehydrogenase